MTTDIPSVFGEARGTSCDSGCVPNRFHNGLDIANNCGTDHFAFPIVAGTATLVVPAVPNCNSGNVKCVRVTSGANFFDYIHVDPTGRVVEGQYVLTTTTLGVIQPANVDGNHLHLNDGSSIGTTLILFNPQFQGRIEYTDADRPTFASATIAGLNREVILVRDGTQASPVAMTFRNGKFYAGGDVDIIATVRNGADRKGVYRVWADVWPIQLSSNTFFPGASSLVFGLLKDGQGDSQDVQRVYYRRQAIATGDSYIPTNFFTGPISPQAVNGRWATFYATQGQQQVCVYAHDHPPPSPHQAKSCVDVVVDNALPSLNVTGPGTVVSNGSIYSSSTTITLEGVDSGGIERFELTGAFSTTTYIDGVETSTSVTHQNLPIGSYKVAVYDLAGNVTSGAFSVWTGTGPSSGEKARGGPVPATFGNDNCYVATSTDLAVGIQSASLSIDGVGLISSRTFACAAAVKFGPFCRLSAGSYTTTFTNCASTSWQLKSTATAAALSLQACGTNPESQTICGSNAPTAAQLLGMSSFTVRTVGGGFPAQDIGRMCLGIATSALGEDQPEKDGCSVYDGSNNNVERRIVGPADWWAGTGTFRVWNANPGSTQTISVNVEIAVSLYDLNGNLVSAATTFTSGGVPYSLDPGEAITGSVSLSEAGQVYPRSTPGGVFKSSFTIKNINVASAPITEPMWDRIRRRGLGISASAVDTSGSEVAFTSAAPISFTYTDTPSSIVTDTATLKIYRWTGVDWDSSAVSGMLVSKDAGSGVILASGTAVRTGVYAAMFDGRDSSAPVMSWGIKGSSYGYGGTTFISTFSYLALSSTDPVVNYYNSGVATTYYRIDGLLGDAYAVYSTSLSFLPGTHWVDSYATDYAGNVSSVTRATVTVTAGSVSKFTSSLQVDGNLLVGFLGSGAKAEVVARAEYTYALMVSSVDGRVMLAVDNANFASIGTAPASGRLTLAGVAGDAALALRSGNSTVAVTGAQLAFGYDGTSDLRHALYTQHGSADYNNKLVFKLWTPATGSSSTLGNLAVLSLEGSSKTASGALVHIMPAGLGENELVVSNGSGLGLGNVLRWERWQPSDAKLKTGIERLGAKDEAKAWKDLMSLKPARYRRKANGPAAPLERGYILEEVPQTFRMGSGISVDERLVSVELALKGAIAEMDALEERLKKLRAGRR